MDVRDKIRIAQGIRSALADGVADEDIVNHLSSDPSVGEGIKSAMSDGIKSSDILNHLGKLNADRKNNPYVANPTEGMTGTEKFKAGMGKAFVDTKRAVEQMSAGVGLGGAGLTEAGPIDPAAQSYYQGVEAQKSTLQSEVDESKKLDAPLMNTGAGLAGNIAGKAAVTAPLLAMPGANTIIGSAAMGGLQGALDPTATGESRLENIKTGAEWGAGSSTVLKGIGLGLKGAKVDPKVKALMDEGVTPTPGQIMGGSAKRLEEGATSLPFLGDQIKAAQRRAVEDFNRSALNRVLKPINQAIEKDAPLGRETLDAVHTKVSDAYEQLLPNLVGKADNEFLGRISSVKDILSELPEQRAKQLEGILQNTVIGKFDKSGNIYGEGLKEMESKLGALVSRYRNSPDGDQRALGEAITSVKDAVRDMLIRNNPESATALKSVNEAYAKMLRVERAAASTGAKEGVFSPSQLQNASKALDPSLRKTQFARGNALMQDLAETGKNVLGSTVPDSGTPFRLGMLGKDAIFGAGGAMTGVYSKTGQRLLSKALTKGGITDPALLEAGDIVKQGVSFGAPIYRLSDNKRKNGN